jgi:hypothetical protein
VRDIVKSMKDKPHPGKKYLENTNDNELLTKIYKEFLKLSKNNNESKNKLTQKNGQNF